MSADAGTLRAYATHALLPELVVHDCLAGAYWCWLTAYMPDWLQAVLFVAGYLVLMRWILPRFGVPT